MRTGRLIVLVLGLIVLVMGISNLASSRMPHTNMTEEIEKRFAIQTGRWIRVEGRHGTIRYENWDQDEVRIVARKEIRGLVWGNPEQHLKSAVVDFSQDADGINVVQRSRVGLFLPQVVVHYHVYVPGDWSGRVSLKTSNGTIQAEGLDGDADLRTSNGSVTVEGQAGVLKVRTSNGAIALKDVKGTISAESSNGAIRVEDAVLQNTSQFRTSNGAVSLHASMENRADVDLKTSNGRITLDLVNPDVSLDLSTSNGRIDLKADVTVSEISGRRLVGRIGDGTSRLTARTSNGSITLTTQLTDSR